MLPREIVKKIQRIRITTNRLVDAGLGGEYHSVFRGRGMEFSEVRAYVPGDDVRAIDWNVTARTGVPHVKKFVEERDLTALLVVDLSRSQEFGSRFLTKRALMAELADFVQYGASPRATLALLSTARAHAFLQGRGYVIPEDVKEVAPDVLRHRVLLSYEAEAENVSSDQVVSRILERIEVP